MSKTTILIGLGVVAVAGAGIYLLVRRRGAGDATPPAAGGAAYVPPSWEQPAGTDAGDILKGIGSMMAGIGQGIGTALGGYADVVEAQHDATSSAGG